jgi:membrane protein implicated in regulation of membrane protease activity
MGTLSYTVTNYGAARGQAPVLRGSAVRTSYNFTTSTSADDVQDGSGDITRSRGEVIAAYADEAMRLSFGGVAATAHVGHYIPAGELVEIECEQGGTVSVRDIA